MNCKLEKFWNAVKSSVTTPYISMNCKLEKFWNRGLKTEVRSQDLNEL